MSFSKAANLINKNKNIIAFTGAGISTPSSIPDFRSPGTGLWNLIEPDEIPTFSKFKVAPETFYQSFKPLLDSIIQAEPNPAHYALTKLEKTEKLNSTITQNIDMLHQKSGSELVIELHGSLETATCMSCYKRVRANISIKNYLKNDIIPKCESCGSILKPDIILFEEQLPHQAWLQAQQKIIDCDLLLVIGSSLETYPAGYLPFLAARSGAEIIVINNSKNNIDLKVNLFILDDASVALPGIMKLL